MADSLFDKQKSEFGVTVLDPFGKKTDTPVTDFEKDDLYKYNATFYRNPMTGEPFVRELTTEDRKKVALNLLKLPGGRQQAQWAYDEGILDENDAPPSFFQNPFDGKPAVTREAEINGEVDPQDTSQASSPNPMGDMGDQMKVSFDMGESWEELVESSAGGDAYIRELYEIHGPEFQRQLEKYMAMTGKNRTRALEDFKREMVREEERFGKVYNRDITASQNNLVNAGVNIQSPRALQTVAEKSEDLRQAHEQAVADLQTQKERGIEDIEEAEILKQEELQQGLEDTVYSEFAKQLNLESDYLNEQFRRYDDMLTNAQLEGRPFNMTFGEYLGGSTEEYNPARGDAPVQMLKDNAYNVLDQAQQNIQTKLQDPTSVVEQPTQLNFWDNGLQVAQELADSTVENIPQRVTQTSQNVTPAPQATSSSPIVQALPTQTQQVTQPQQNVTQPLQRNIWDQGSSLAQSLTDTVRNITKQGNNRSLPRPVSTTDYVSPLAQVLQQQAPGPTPSPQYSNEVNSTIARQIPTMLRSELIRSGLTELPALQQFGQELNPFSALKNSLGGGYLDKFMNEIQLDYKYGQAPNIPLKDYMAQKYQEYTGQQLGPAYDAWYSTVEGKVRDNIQKTIGQGTSQGQRVSSLPGIQDFLSPTPTAPVAQAGPRGPFVQDQTPTQPEITQPQQTQPTLQTPQPQAALTSPKIIGGGYLYQDGQGQWFQKIPGPSAPTPKTPQEVASSNLPKQPYEVPQPQAAPTPPPLMDQGTPSLTSFASISQSPTYQRINEIENQAPVPLTPYGQEAMEKYGFNNEPNPPTPTSGWYGYNQGTYDQLNSERFGPWQNFTTERNFSPGYTIGNLKYNPPQYEFQYYLPEDYLSTQKKNYKNTNYLSGALNR